jgi:hypothetical protein
MDSPIYPAGKYDGTIPQRMIELPKNDVASVAQAWRVTGVAYSPSANYPAVQMHYLRFRGNALIYG